jgi:cephalosporin hydroxylase
MKITKDSLDLVLEITKKINNQTFHHHYHILYDIANTFDDAINYVEIGCYAGGSACLMLQRPKTNVVSIDLGRPINPKIVYENVKNLNVHSNSYNYLEGSSQSENMVNRLKEIVQNINILFIDGDHSYNGVINDFNLYEKMVVSGGYIVFDDYYDNTSSPGVRKAVDDLVKTINGYEIIGTLVNEFNARGFSEDFKLNNCFIIKKL